MIMMPTSVTEIDLAITDWTASHLKATASETGFALTDMTTSKQKTKALTTSVTKVDFMETDVITNHLKTSVIITPVTEINLTEIDLSTNNLKTTVMPTSATKIDYWTKNHSAVPQTSANQRIFTAIFHTGRKMPKSTSECASTTSYTTLANTYSVGSNVGK